jgi:hypothetical protein
VIYVAGSMRSGTTLLGEMLGSADDAVSIGETTLLWQALAEDWPCSCGARATHCPLWSHVLVDLSAAGLDVPELAHVQTLALREVRTRRLPVLLHATVRPGAHPAGDVDLVVQALRVATRSVLDHANAEIVVETTKFLPGLVLRALAGPSELAVVHLIRDARGVCASNVTPLEGPPRPGDPFSRSVVSAAFTWSAENLLLATMAPPRATYTMVRYERLAEQPEPVLRHLGLALGLDWRSPVVSGSRMLPRHGHVLVGNPMRLQKGPRQIAPDNRWKTRLSRRQATAVAVTTAGPKMIATGVGRMRTRANIAGLP